MNTWPQMGCGIGLRTPHYSEILKTLPKVDWFEAVSENFMDSGGRPLSILEKIRSHYPVALHGVSLSIGSVDPLNQDYLKRLKTLADRIDPFVVSDHLCWTGVDNQNLHDLLPLPFTEEAIEFIVERVDGVQNFLGRKILLENVSTYVTYQHSVMPEWEFLVEIAKRSGCGILLDLNNVYVNSKNHGFDPIEYIQNVPGSLVGQFHLAGHTDMGKYLFDTHSAKVVEPVWDLYEKALALYGPVTTLIEWDDQIPDLAGLMAEAEKAKAIASKIDPLKNNSKKAAAEVRKNVNMNNAPSLKQVQHALKERIQPGHEADKATGFLNLQAGEAGEARLSVYANGYVARIAESLSESYEAIRHLLGKENFLHLCEQYAKAYPSQNYNLNEAGIHFEAFLKDNPILQKYPFLPDLARLEWRIAKAFHSFEKPKADFSNLSALSEKDWERLRVYFQPSFAVIQSEWPIHDLWTARKTPLEKIDIDLKDRPQAVLVGRSGVEVLCEKISPIEFLLLENLLAGGAMGDVCESLADRFADQEIPIGEWLGNWVQKGFIARAAAD